VGGSFHLLLTQVRLVVRKPKTALWLPSSGRAVKERKKKCQWTPRASCLAHRSRSSVAWAISPQGKCPGKHGI